MKKLYFFLSMMLVAFAVNAETLTVNVSYTPSSTDENGDYVYGDQEYGDDVTVEATINNGVVTISDFLSSGKTIKFTCYTNGKVYHNWGSGWVSGSFTFSNFGTYSSLYLYGNDGEYYGGELYVDAEYCDDEYGKYIYFGTNAYSSDYFWYEVYVLLPDDFEPTVYKDPVVLSGTATAALYNRVDGAASGDSADIELGYMLTDNQLQITNAFGYTALSSYLSYTLNEDGTVTPAIGQTMDYGANTGYYYTKAGAYTVNGTSYDRLYDGAATYDIANNSFIWDVAFGLTSDSYATLTDYRVILPLPEAFAAGVKTIAVDSDENAPVEYYNLQGIRVANPTQGLYIRRQGKTATKLIIR